MTPIVRAALLATAVVIGLSAIPLTAVSGSFLATRAVAAAMRKAEAKPDFLTLAAAPKPDASGVAVNSSIHDRPGQG